MQPFKCKVKMAFQVLKLFEIVNNRSHSPPVSSLLSQNWMPRRLLPLHQARLNLALGLKLIGAGNGQPEHNLLSFVYRGNSSH